MKFTKDPIEVLLTKLVWSYSLYKGQGETFKGQDEYSVIREILSVLERNKRSKREPPKLTLIKETTSELLGQNEKL